MIDDANETYTPQEVAEILKITKNTVYELIKRNELKGFKAGKKLRINKKDVNEYLNRGISAPEKVMTHSDDLLFSHPGTPSGKNNQNNRTFVIAGQDMILDILAGNLQKRLPEIKFVRSYSGSYNALMELYFDEVHAATAHLWDAETNEYNFSYIKKLLPGIPAAVIHIAVRTVGFYVQKGNPKNIQSFKDLFSPDVTMINREKGSGIRVLLDESIKKLKRYGNEINGYNRESTSHLVVAGTVSRGGADVGIGNEKTSQKVNGIDFIPIQKEQYDMVIRYDDLEYPVFRSLIAELQSPAFRNEIEALGGYNCTSMGQITVV